MEGEEEAIQNNAIKLGDDDIHIELSVKPKSPTSPYTNTNNTLSISIHITAQSRGLSLSSKVLSYQ